MVVMGTTHDHCAHAQNVIASLWFAPDPDKGASPRTKRDVLSRKHGPLTAVIASPSALSFGWPMREEKKSSVNEDGFMLVVNGSLLASLMKASQFF